MRLPLTLPPVIGHRGAPCQAPENTMAGFARAAALGLSWVELDVQLSRDLQPVVFHDDRLERTSNGVGRLIETDAEQLLGLDVGSWFAPRFADQRLPAWGAVLHQLLALGLGVNIEIKAEDDRAAVTAERALTEVLARWPADLSPPLVSSFSRAALVAAGRVAPDLPRGLVWDHWPDDWHRLVPDYGCSTLHVRREAVTAERVTLANQAGLAVLAYVVDAPDLAHQVWQCGVAAVFSDRPDLLLGCHPGTNRDRKSGQVGQSTP